MIKLAGALLGALVLCSCGEIPEVKPLDWSQRKIFSDKPYGGMLFTAWDEEVTQDNIAAQAGDDVQNLSDSWRWKGSGTFNENADPFYYIFRAPSTGGRILQIDWRYREDEDRIDFAYKKVGGTVTDYDYDDQEITIGANEYFVVKIFVKNGTLPSSSGVDWELGFTAK